MTKRVHTILNEFPEMSERIHTIKGNNVHFARLSEKYDELESGIHHMQNSGEAYTDEHMEELKKKRLKLRDELFAILQKVPVDHGYSGGRKMPPDSI
jgi:uncharacterized protein YdcH (DUF465 family)